MCSLSDKGSRNASTAAINTGKYSGRPPAIASAIAQDLTVARAPRGRNFPSSCSPGSCVPCMIQSTRALVAGQIGKPSPQRLVNSRLLALVSASS